MVEMITYDPEIFNETWNKISNVTEKRMKVETIDNDTIRLISKSQYDAYKIGCFSQEIKKCSVKISDYSDPKMKSEISIEFSVNDLLKMKRGNTDEDK